MERQVRISSVRILCARRVELTLTDGRCREVNLAPFLHGPIFDPIREDDGRFAEVRVDPEFGALEWPTRSWLRGADICPDVLIYDRPPV